MSGPLTRHTQYARLTPCAGREMHHSALNGASLLLVRGALTCGSAPARLLVEADAKRRLAYDFVREHRVGRMKAASSNVAIQALQFARLEHAAPARRGQRQINN